MTTAIASSGGRCRSVVLTERYARPPRVARTHHRRSHSKLSETQFREGFSAPRYPPNVPPDHPTLDLRPERGSPPPHPTLDLGRQRWWGGGDYEVPPWGGTLARYLPEVPPSPFKGPLLQRDDASSAAAARAAADLKLAEAEATARTLKLPA